MPEFLINRWIADRKSPRKASLKGILKSAKEQGCQVVVIDLENYPYSMENVLNKLPKIFSQKETYKTIERVIIVNQDSSKVVEWIRP